MCTKQLNHVMISKLLYRKPRSLLITLQLHGLYLGVNLHFVIEHVANLATMTLNRNHIG